MFACPLPVGHSKSSPVLFLWKSSEELASGTIKRGLHITHGVGTSLEPKTVLSRSHVVSQKRIREAVYALWNLFEKLRILLACLVPAHSSHISLQKVVCKNHVCALRPSREPKTVGIKAYAVGHSAGV